MTSPFTYLLDDSDPRIQYSLGWQRGGLAPEFNSSTTYTDSLNETLTVSFVGEPHLARTAARDIKYVVAVFDQAHPSASLAPSQIPR